MKTLTLFLIGFVLTLSACKPTQKTAQASEAKFDSPEATFQTLLAAIRNKDMELYKQCWHPGRMEKEGQVSKITENPKLWDELQALFKGNPVLGKGGPENTHTDRVMMRFKVENPDVENGIGAISMVKDEGKWLMYTW